jgi:predicted acylesterase/phospholipase RssA
MSAMATIARDVAEQARHALVLSGGGARGAYEVGVAKALFEGRSRVVADPRQVTVFTGTSVGAYNAAFLAQEERGAEAIGRLEALWRDRIAGTLENCGNGVYRLRWDPFRFLDPGCLRNPLQLLTEVGRDAGFWGMYAAAYGSQLLSGSGSPVLVRLFETVNIAALFSREPLKSLLADTIDLARLRATANDLAIVASDWRNGLVKVYSKDDVIRIGTDTILASTAIPGVFAPVVVEGTPCVDGGLLQNTPLKPAIRAGADVLHVIYVDPLTQFVPFPELPNTIDTAYRVYTILLASQINGDARFIAAINHELAELSGGGGARRGELPAARAAKQDRAGERIRAAQPVSRLSGAPGRDLPAVRARRSYKGGQADEKVYRPLTIHRYRPKTDLGGAEAFLDFSLPAIERMIHQGYEDALSHNCREAQCVLPPDVPPVAGLRGGPA